MLQMIQKKAIYIIRYEMLFLSILFLFVGIFTRNEVQILFNKAVNICMQCIGLG